MSTSTHPEPDLDKPAQTRTGHGTASVIARLRNEQISRVDSSVMYESADEPAARETPTTEMTVAVDTNPRPT